MQHVLQHVGAARGVGPGVKQYRSACHAASPVGDVGNSLGLVSPAEVGRRLERHGRELDR